MRWEWGSSRKTVWRAIFRDIAGRVNQRLAAAADEVWLAVSGIGVKIK